MLRLRLGFAFATLTAAALSIGESNAKASLIDVGVQGGFVKRSLSDTSYKMGFAWQLHGEIALLPPILMLGPYFGMQTLTPEPKKGGDPRAITFRTIGGRVKLKLPIPGPFKPYGIAGVGWVNANFPDVTLTVCDPQTGTVCASKAVPNLEANFVEFVLGAGAMIELAGPLMLTLDFSWRPTTGYKNDQYEKALQGQNPDNPQTPPPSRNGVAWTGLAGLALSF